VSKAALLGSLIRPAVGPGMANRFMTNEAFKASRGTGAKGVVQRVGSEVATALTPTRSAGVMDNLGGIMQFAQAHGKTKDTYKMLDPKLASDVLRSHLKKEGALPAGLGSDMAKALMIGTGLAVAGAGVGAAASGVGSMFTRLQASRMYDELRRRHPEVKSNPKSRQYFDLIVAYAPSLMRHPSAIGDFLLRQLQYPMSSVEFIKQLADLEATVSKTGRDSIGSNVGRASAEFAASPVSNLAFPRKTGS
jgi:hypothetical protein